MSKNTGNASRHVEGGLFRRKCANPDCPLWFETDNPRLKYHTYECKSHAQNKRFYERNKARMIARSIATRKRRK